MICDKSCKFVWYKYYTKIELHHFMKYLMLNASSYTMSLITGKTSSTGKLLSLVHM